MMQQSDEKPSRTLVDRLLAALAHHEAKAGQLKDAIAYVKQHPDFEKFYDVVQKVKQ